MSGMGREVRMARSGVMRGGGEAKRGGKNGSGWHGTYTHTHTHTYTHTHSHTAGNERPLPAFLWQRRPFVSVIPARSLSPLLAPLSPLHTRTARSVGCSFNPPSLASLSPPPHSPRLYRFSGSTAPPLLTPMVAEVHDGKLVRRPGHLDAQLVLLVERVPTSSSGGVCMRAYKWRV